MRSLVTRSHVRMHGAYVSVTVAIVSVVCGVIVGGLIGSLVGYVRGKTETALMAMIDVLLAFPALVLLLALISIFEVRDLFVISLVIGLLSIPAYTRVSRANSLAISNREFVLAAQAIGTKRWTILRREIIPNVLPTLLAYAMVAAAAVVVVEGSLSFLGLSVQLPQSSWGNMINQARRDIKVNFGQILYPSMILTLTGPGVEPGRRLLPASQRLPRLVALSVTLWCQTPCVTLRCSLSCSRGRKNCTSGPMPRANTAVPTPMAPPSAMPMTSTVTSIAVRANRIEMPRSAKPVIKPSRGPGPSPAPM